MVSMALLLNLLYHAIVLGLVAVLVRSMFELRDPRRQVMCAVVIIPFVLRVLNLK
jgi:hypothetical protein